LDLREKTPPLSVGVLRELFRNLQAWKSLFESEGIDVLCGPDGQEWCLWDVEYLYSQLDQLPRRQRQAIQLGLIENIKERDVAIIMGVSPTNPVFAYAASGIERLIELIYDGRLPQFKGGYLGRCDQ
jgi:hypothetical protein